MNLHGSRWAYTRGSGSRTSAHRTRLGRENQRGLISCNVNYDTTLGKSKLQWQGLQSPACRSSIVNKYFSKHVSRDGLTTAQATKALTHFQFICRLFQVCSAAGCLQQPNPVAFFVLFHFLYCLDTSTPLLHFLSVLLFLLRYLDKSKGSFPFLDCHHLGCHRGLSRCHPV